MSLSAKNVDARIRSPAKGNHVRVGARNGIRRRRITLCTGRRSMFTHVIENRRPKMEFSIFNTGHSKCLFDDKTCDFPSTYRIRYYHYSNYRDSIVVFCEGQYQASRNNSNSVITSRNTSTNLVVLLCRCLALTSCLFPISTLSVVSIASSYKRSVREACDVNCVMSSF